MSKIKNFRDFLNERENFSSLEESDIQILESIVESIEQEQLEEGELNEGWKDVLVAGLISLATIGGVKAQDLQKIATAKGGKEFMQVIDRTKVKGEKGAKDSIDVTMKGRFSDRAKAEEIIARLTKSGWNLPAPQIDTVWKEVAEKAPKTEVKVFSMKYDAEAYFASGKFNIDPEMKNGIDSTMDQLSDRADIQLMKIDITSSTDKQGIGKALQDTLKAKGFSPDNKGLSKARSSEIKNFIAERGVNDTLITETNLVEGGEGEIDQSARFVKIDFFYIVTNTAKSPDTITRTPSEFITITAKKRVPFETGSRKNWKFKLFDLGTVRESGSRGSLECPQW